MNNTKTTASGYLTVRATRGSSWQDYRVTSSKIVRLTQTKPEHLQGDEIVVKVKIIVPNDAFEPYTAPEMEIEYTKPELTLSVEG